MPQPQVSEGRGTSKYYASVCFLANITLLSSLYRVLIQRLESSTACVGNRGCVTYHGRFRLSGSRPPESDHGRRHLTSLESIYLAELQLSSFS